ncbi:MAG: histidine phosphatase family protein [Verrucomicrobiota bacterium]
MKCVTQSIWFFRHPETDWNAAKRYQGWSDRPLTERGQGMVERLSKVYPRGSFDVVISSGRSHTNALANVLGDFDEDSRWAEIDHGDWEGLTWNEVKERFAPDHEARFADALNSDAHGGETLTEIDKRIGEAWRQLLDEHSGKRVAIVTHCTPIQLVLCQITTQDIRRHWQFKIDCGSVTSLDVAPSGVILNFSNQQA